MLKKIINFSIKNKLIVLLFTVFGIGVGIYSVTQLPLGAVPDITNNQVQVITTSKSLSTQDIEQFVTYPIELEMANVPGVKEIRSVSKFGLSVVTIVFEDEMGTYLPRQLIAEKIKSASEKIPPGFGTPQMGPITTGLGEIYQYILDVKPEYKDKYSSTELRTIQDWIVRRQLSGIKGVVEVNTWGGLLKQYEVAINTQKLHAMNVTISEVFNALENNNSVAGGGYIEKVNQAYFIRGEGLVSSLKDIENIVVKNTNNVPVYIKNIGKVNYGSAPRFGAITGNGEGEKVMGQVMMLKGGNSSKIIANVKQRVEEIQHTLPEGVYINGFLERSELIEKTTFTVTENLILGFLIVLFVVVLLIGNLRSGLIVASVIPLSLLFTLTLMNLFGVNANLMSLGAIDFGIIIDGAVIIVEFVAFQISTNHSSFMGLNKNEAQEKKDEITQRSASKMMNSAIFGQLIILIVFIPILSLSGVEGKMFKPMALTFSFALIGAMVLCLTYVPVMASLFLKPAKQSKKNISTSIMNFLNKIYEPVINFALNKKKIILGIAFTMLVVTGVIFSRMGGEFIPTLDEGDFVIQPVLKTGTSLSETIEKTTKIEQVLLDNFPEVTQAITRIGAAEVPTDPMSMEESDVIIRLKPKSEWTTAETKDDLAQKMDEKLKEEIPGLEVEFTQPIEMRFNELITGVRADIAVKIFGEDLDVLSKKANQIKEVINGVEGASDIIVEKTVGLPQMSVKFNREKIARYGLNIAELNDIIAMGFAGKSAGSVFEGEKRFDLVLRLDENNRKDITDLENLYVDVPNGEKIPLNELAEISYKKGAAKISRDDTKRRIVVGINVRNRDLQSVVDDIRKRIETNVELPTGYTITYGGQFENLQNAINRLKIAVPIALILIFILLYFAFHSVKEALLIYSAIPLSAIGGVVFLWIRGLPFSISAGVGFIALFGIAVLNGIVLIERFKELKKEGHEDGDELIKSGAQSRLRAVLLTALAAALGFLPMAISHGAGAEVQRPLATVVIGGLLSATMLTLVVLPVLYSLYTSKVKISLKKSAMVLILITGGLSVGNSQTNELTFEEIRTLMLENNKQLKVNLLKIKQSEVLTKSSFNIDKTNVYYGYDQNNLTVNDEILSVVGVQQSFMFPTVYSAQSKVNKAQIGVENSLNELDKIKLERDLKASYYEFQYAKQKELVYASLDSLYINFSKNASRKFEVGETNYLEKITAQAKQKQIELDYFKAQQEVDIAYNKLKAITQTEKDFSVKIIEVSKLNVKDINTENNVGLGVFKSEKQRIEAQTKLAKQQLLPDLSLEYFQGYSSSITGLYGYQVGIGIPLFFGATKSKISAAKISNEIITEQENDYKIKLQSKYEVLQKELEAYEKSLFYYTQEGNAMASEIINMADKSYKNGEIDIFKYLQSIESSSQIKLNYLKSLNDYNQLVINLNYLTLEN